MGASYPIRLNLHDGTVSLKERPRLTEQEYLESQIEREGPRTDLLERYLKLIEKCPPYYYHRLQDILSEHSGGLDPEQFARFKRRQSAVLNWVEIPSYESLVPGHFTD